MATLSSPAGGQFRVRMDVSGVEKVSQEFQLIRREVAATSREKAKEAAVLEVLPAARRIAGNLKVNAKSVGGSLIATGGGRTVYISSLLRGKENRAVGLLEFGGVVRSVIVPKKRKALMLRGSEHPVSRVGTPRHYAGRHFMRGAVDERLTAYTNRLESLLLGRFGMFD